MVLWELTELGVSLIKAFLARKREDRVIYKRINLLTLREEMIKQETNILLTPKEDRAMFK